ncbi:hypothetical protein KSP39_PZI000247 [Platanthera zijinensis]|uniref:Uncharacterized protein n=1 Tax=Platanthera zijinensis TaxID=2320716 RepID=A0AAP0GFQ2_9ASPA
MEGRGAAAKEEEFKLRTKLIKMEEKVQQQQKELDFLRKQVEGVESANKESPLHLENRDGGKFMKRLAEMCAGDQGMVCLSTVFERDDEGEDRESLEEEVDKEVVDDAAPRPCPASPGPGPGLKAGGQADVE